jgi:hypothetical protein
VSDAEVLWGAFLDELEAQARALEPQQLLRQRLDALGGLLEERIDHVLVDLRYPHGVVFGRRRMTASWCATSFAICIR